jgi:hypothetical protein
LKNIEAKCVISEEQSAFFQNVKVVLLKMTEIAVKDEKVLENLT